MQGGSLAKVVWFSKQSEGGKLNFTKFETAKIDQCLGFLQGLLAERDEKDMGVLRIKGTLINPRECILIDCVNSNGWRIS